MGPLVGPAHLHRTARVKTGRKELRVKGRETRWTVAGQGDPGGATATVGTASDAHPGGTTVLETRFGETKEGETRDGETRDGEMKEAGRRVRLMTGTAPLLAVATTARGSTATVAPRAGKMGKPLLVHRVVVDALVGTPSLRRTASTPVEEKPVPISLRNNHHPSRLTPSSSDLPTPSAVLRLKIYHL